MVTEEMEAILQVLALLSLNTFLLMMALRTIMLCDRESGLFLTNKNVLFLGGIVVIYSVACCRMLEQPAHQSLWMTYLLLMSVTDGQTGYIYTGFCCGMNLAGGFGLAGQILARQMPGGQILERGILAGILSVTPENWVLIWLFLFLVIFLGMVGGMGEGDVFIFISLLIYHLIYSRAPGITANLSLLLSQFLFCVKILVKRPECSQMPLAPSLAMGHFVTVCLFIK